MGIVAHQAMSLDIQGWKESHGLLVGRLSRAWWTKNGQLLLLPLIRPVLSAEATCHVLWLSSFEETQKGL